MTRRRYTPEQIIRKLREAEVMISQGKSISQANRQIGIVDQTSLIKETENIEFKLNYAIFQLLEDKSHLETAYSQIQEKADNLEPNVAVKFLSYPIPKAIVEEWEKVK